MAGKPRRTNGDQPARGDGPRSDEAGNLFFIEPDGSNREEMRRLGYRFVDLVVDAASGANQRPPFSRDIAADRTPYTPPTSGRGLDDLFGEMDQVLRQGMNPAHPGYLGHMDTLASSIGIFSDLIVSAMNNNMLAWEMSPLFTEMEQRVMAWLASLFGLDSPEVRSEAGPMGTMVSGGTLANMTALLVARNAHSAKLAKSGSDATSAPLVFLATENAHFSFRKAANLLGLGRDGWIRVEADEKGRVRPEAMEAALAQAREEGKEPFCLVGVAGTTVTGSIDPLPALAEIARHAGIWFHVDAAYGGALALSPSLKPRLAGIERADSITFNPQKWLFVPKTCATILFRDAAQLDTHLREHFVYGTTNRSSSGDPRVNLGEWTLQGTRRVDVLKLYLTLEHLGTDRLAGFVESQVSLAEELAASVRKHKDLELISEPDMNIVCFRYRGIPRWPEWLDDDSPLDRLNAKIHEGIEQAGAAWLSLPRYRKRSVLRVVILHPRSTSELLHAVLDDALRIGREVLTARA